ncbi:Ig-like domain-containing protein [Paenibacillus glufosinatiresistens]|uniref:Ig-like domain-containing protein n=1 Tax=Paenibacillus glufosinatiresistens TaxID=3070657 RepID=UPI00286DCB1F|nr:Ig-like domain-containing protein [Paenibacillus sp. YX.27]
MRVNRRWNLWLLVLVLFAAAAFPAGAYAAAGDVTSIELDSGAKLDLTVGQSPKQLKVLAAVEGSTVKKDVTAGAVWTSSNSAAVAVSGGVVTAVGAGSALVKATYGSSVATVEVSASYPYKNLKIENGAAAYKLGDSAESLKLQATAAGGATENGTVDVTKDADWSSSNSSVLAVADGQLTLAGEGTATVTAKYKGLSAAFKATVKLPYASLALVRDGEPTEELELLVGDDPVQLEAEAGSSGEEVEPVWSSSNAAVVTVENGLITAVAPGKATVTARYLGVAGSVDVYVRAPYEALLLKPAGNSSLFIGESMKVKSEVRDSANSTLNVSGDAVWTSDNQLAVTLAKDSDGVKLTARAAGVSNIKAEYKGLTRTFRVTVYPTLSGLEAEKNELALYTSGSAALPKVSGIKLDGDKIDMSGEMVWTSADEDVAEIAGGKIVAGEPGKTVLTGRLESERFGSSASPVRSKALELTVTVKNKTLVLIGPDSPLSVVIGETVPLPGITAVLDDGNERDVTSEIVWSLNGVSAVIKTVDTGKVIKGLTKGNAVLKGVYGDKTISIPVTAEPKIVKLELESGSLELNLKTSKTLKVTGYYTNGKTVNLSSGMNWTSSNTSVATVKGMSVKAAAEGSATLTGSYQGLPATVKISVVPKLKKLSASDTKLKLPVGASYSLAVTAEYDTGKTVSVTPLTGWSSSKPSVAAVSDKGVVTAVSKGTAVLKGKFGGKTVTVSVTVK